jgi:hypothetical protein
MATPASNMAEPERSYRLQLLQRLSEQADRVQQLTSRLSEEAMSARQDGDWSLKEIVGHLYRCQTVFEARIVAMVTEDNPAIAVYDPDADAEFPRVLNRPAQDLVLGFATNRALIVGQLGTYSDAEWGRRGQHEHMVDYNVQNQVEHMLYHEARHIYQMMQRRSQLDLLDRC